MKPLFLVLLMAASPVAARDLLIQSTTSTQNSGLFGHILPLFTNDTGLVAQVVAVGTGQALRNAQNCDGDVLIVHSTADERAFVENGFGDARFDLMYNDFVLIGPREDPAGLSEATDLKDALKRLETERFLSRGDDSGTHKAEVRLWQTAGLTPGAGRLETGQGMGATLNMTVSMRGYTLSDRATWAAFGNKGDHTILFEGDPALFNQYGLIVISPDHCPNAAHVAAMTFQNWMLGPPGQSAIASYQIDGTQVFTPNARP